MNWPTTCAEVTIDLLDEAVRGDEWFDCNIGDLLWNPKGGEGHLLVAEAGCRTTLDGISLYCGNEGYTACQPNHVDVLVCECGEDDSYRDHHYFVLARKPGAEI